MNRGSILVTGGAGGIGLASSKALAADGFAVALADVDGDAAAASAATLTAAGHAAIGQALDVTDAAGTVAAIAMAERELGPVAGAVAAAGVMRKAPFLELDRAGWERTIAINLTGVFVTAQEVGRHLVAAGRPGALVAISSVAGRRGRAEAADYAASKAGVISLVHSAGVALAPHGVRVNAICPGVVDTPMTRRNTERVAELEGITPDDALARLVATVPLGRMQTPDDVADVVSFLFSAKASYLTGQAINVCGGLELG